MKWIVMTWQEQCFREPWAMDGKSSDESHKEVTPQKGKQRATCAEQRNPRNSAKDHAPLERRGTLNRRQPRDQKKTDTFSILRGSQNIPLVYLFTQAHAWNTLTSSTLTAWENGMVQRLFTWHPSPLRSSTTLTGTCQAAPESNLRGTRAPNLVEHLCLLESTNSCPTNQDWCHIDAHFNFLL